MFVSKKIFQRLLTRNVLRILSNCVSSIYIPFVTKYRKASNEQVGLATPRRSVVEALERPFEANTDVSSPNASYGTPPDPYIGKAFN